MRILLWLLAIGILLAGGGYWYWQRSVPQVEVVLPWRGTAVQAIYATGVVEPEYWAKVAPLVPGRLAEIFVEEGQKVRAGQPLARLDDREARARVEELEARERYWRDELARQRALAERGVASRETVARTEAEHRAVEAALAAARQRQRDLLIAAPIDGAVLRRDGEIGEVVDSNDVVFWVGRRRPLWVIADVNEEDIAAVVVGQTALIRADAFPERALQGRVIHITPKGDPDNKTFRVRVALPDDTPLMIGMTVEVNIVVREVENALLIPAAALGSGGTVFVALGGAAQARQPEFGVRGRNRLEVIEGIDEGEPVILQPPTSLEDGQRIRATLRPPQP